MDQKEFLKNYFGVPENWDMYDYQTKRYSFEDMEEAMIAYENNQPKSVTDIVWCTHVVVDGVHFVSTKDGGLLKSSDQINWTKHEMVDWEQSTFEIWLANNGYLKNANGEYIKDGMIWAISSLKIKFRIDTTIIE